MADRDEAREALRSLVYATDENEYDWLGQEVFDATNDGIQEIISQQLGQLPGYVGDL